MTFGEPARRPGDERDRGSALIARFNGALRGARMYGAQSPTLQQLVGELLELVQSLMEDELRWW